MGGDRGFDKFPDEVPPTGVQSYHWDDDCMWGRQGVGISPGGGNTEILRITPHKGVHKEAEDPHSGKGGMLPNL